jgi:hypothetical protein
MDNVGVQLIVSKSCKVATLFRVQGLVFRGLVLGHRIVSMSCKVATLLQMK